MRSANRRKLGRDKAYLEWLRTLRCIVCRHIEVTFQAQRGIQTSPTEAAHVGPRGLSQKCPDREALPLCAEHHREGQFSQHAMGRFFWGHHGLNRDELLDAFNTAYEAERLGVLSPMDVIGTGA